jgi:hypothetical protein
MKASPELLNEGCSDGPRGSCLDSSLLIGGVSIQPAKLFAASGANNASACLCSTHPADANTRRANDETSTGFDAESIQRSDLLCDAAGSWIDVNSLGGFFPPLNAGNTHRGIGRT